MKIGTTSYIYPADVIPNVRKLSDLVDDIEIVLFEGKEYSNLPSKEDVWALKEIGDEGQITYTIHLPIDLDVCSKGDEFRRFSLGRTIEIMELTSTLHPRGYILHLPRKGVDSEKRWLLRATSSLSKIYGVCTIEKVLIENMSYPIKYLVPVIEKLNSNLCLDICHAIRCSDDWVEIFDTYFDRIKAIHFYGHETNSEGHTGLQRVERSFIREVVREIVDSKFSGLLTLEVFGTEDFFESIRILKEELSFWKEKY